MFADRAGARPASSPLPACGERSAPSAATGEGRATKPVLVAAIFAALFALVALAAAPAAAAPRPLLQGPHPFARENAVSASGGYSVANEISGVRAGIGYGYELAGSLWFDLRFDLVSGSTGPPLRDAVCDACAEVEKLASVMGGLAYRLRADIPIIPYAAVTAGPLFLFNRGARGAIGIGLRGVAGARYYIYDWLGLGLELGGLAGGAVVDEPAGLSSNLFALDLGISAELQF